MVKRVLTSIITVTVLMGVLVSCGGSGGEITETSPEPEQLEESEKRDTETEKAEETDEELLPIEQESSTKCGLSLSWDDPTCQVVTIKVGTEPVDVVSDGTYIWVLNRGGSSGCSTLSKINPASTQIVDTIKLGCNKGSRSMAFDGTYLWVVHGDGAICGGGPSALTAQCLELMLY